MDAVKTYVSSSVQTCCCVQQIMFCYRNLLSCFLYSIFLLPFKMTTESWGKEYDTDVVFSAEYSIVSYFLPVDQFQVSVLNMY